MDKRVFFGQNIVIKNTLRIISKQLAVTLWRERWTELLAAAALTLVFLVAHLAALLSFLAGSAVGELQQKVDMTVFIARDASPLAVQAFEEQLAVQVEQGKIVRFSKLDKADALQEFKRLFPDKIGFLQRFGAENPLATMFTVVPPASEQALAQLETWLTADQWHDTIDQRQFARSQKLRDFVRKFLHGLQWSSGAIYVIWLLFVLIAFALVFHVISLMLRHRQGEISVMRLVGARLMMIRWPLLLEGLVLFAIAFVASLLVLWLTMAQLQSAVSELLLSAQLNGDAPRSVFDFARGFMQITAVNGLLFLAGTLAATVLAVERGLRREVV